MEILKMLMKASIQLEPNLKIQDTKGLAIS